jgi:ribosomal protein L29
MAGKRKRIDPEYEAFRAESDERIRQVRRRIAEADVRAGRVPDPEDLPQAERTKRDLARARAYIAELERRIEARRAASEPPSA